MFLRPNISKHKYVCVESLGAFYVFILCKGNDKRTSFYDQQFYYEAQWYNYYATVLLQKLSYCKCKVVGLFIWGWGGGGWGWGWRDAGKNSTVVVKVKTYLFKGTFV